jgi:hypothetical protein
MRINVHIDRLVVDGFDLDRRQRPLMQAAFERELARLLAQDGLSSEMSSGVALRSLNAPSIQIAKANNSPDAFGEQVAQAVYRGMGQ